MKIEIRNVGLLGMDDIPAKLDIGELTIITGCNNSGKTYAAYSLFGLWMDGLIFAQFLFLMHFLRLWNKLGLQNWI